MHGSSGATMVTARWYYRRIGYTTLTTMHHVYGDTG
jgi:hypothetical protein